MDTNRVKHVLVVWDHPHFLKGLKEALEQAGFAVTPADSGDEGLAKAREIRFDLIVLDFLLEERQTAEAFLPYFKELNPGVPIVIMSNLPLDDVDFFSRFGLKKLRGQVADVIHVGDEPDWEERIAGRLRVHIKCEHGC
jgi:CheY-like chemotaxis protein